MGAISFRPPQGCYKNEMTQFKVLRIVSTTEYITRTYSSKGVYPELNPQHHASN